MLENTYKNIRTALLYLIFASLLVFLSDQALGRMLPDAEFLAWVQANQAILLVAVSAVLIFYLLSLQSRYQLPVSQDAGESRGREQLFVKLGLENIRLARDFDHTLERLAVALELCSREPKNHYQRVTEMTLALSRLLGVPEEELGHIRRGALLHDIGKVGLPDTVVLKNGPLTEEERAVMEQHPLIAADLFSNISYLQPAMEIPCSHHERWDGSGYPHGLKSEEIPLSARIFAVVDVYDALTSDRPYRKALPHRAAITFIRSQSGTHFDPQVVDAFLKMKEAAREESGVSLAV